MKKLHLLLGLMLFAFAAFAQDAQPEPKWKYKGQTGLNFTQTGFSEYWAGGGENSYSLVWNANFGLDYKSEKSAWNNTLDLGFGLTKQGEQDLRKMVDKIDFLSKYSLNGFSDKWRYTALINFKTQFADGFKYDATTGDVLVSSFLAPAYITGSFGIEYLGSDKLKIFISPASEKTTVVSESYYDKKVENRAFNTLNAGAPIGEEFEPNEAEIAQAETQLETTTTYGLAWRENTRFEVGALAQLIYDNPEVMKNIGFKTRLDLFAAYANITKVDVDWEAWLTFKFNKYFSANINAQLIYDDDIRFEMPDGKQSPKIQFRELLGLGVVYTFN